MLLTVNEDSGPEDAIDIDRLSSQQLRASAIITIKKLDGGKVHLRNVIKIKCDVPTVAKKSTINVANV